MKYVFARKFDVEFIQSIPERKVQVAERTFYFFVFDSTGFSGDGQQDISYAQVQRCNAFQFSVIQKDIAMGKFLVETIESQPDFEVNRTAVQSGYKVEFVVYTFVVEYIRFIYTNQIIFDKCVCTRYFYVER